MLFLVFSNTFLADDVSGSISETLEFFKDGDYTAAVENLSYASQLIQQKKVEPLETFLLNPLDGWIAKQAKSQAAGAAMLGGGITV